MAAPSMSPFHVDGSRFGGSSASLRHNFGMASKAPAAKKPRFIPAPPKRNLGQGLATAPELTANQIEAIRDKVTPVIDAISFEMEAIKAEADWVSGPALRTEPDSYKQISVIGQYFTPQEVRSQILIDVNEIGKMASRLLSGAVGSYMSPPQAEALGIVISDAKALTQYIEQFDLAPITGAKSKLSEDHVAAHIEPIKASLENIERSVVSGEAGSVPVIEPMERGFGWGSLLAVGALVAVGFLIVDLAG